MGVRYLKTPASFIVLERRDHQALFSSTLNCLKFKITIFRKQIIELRPFLEIMTLNGAKDTQNDKNPENKNNA